MIPRRRGAVATATALLALLAPASAVALQDRLPHELPPAGAHAATRLPATWILGVRDTPRARALARRAGARVHPVARTVTIATVRARALAAALRGDGLLRYAEPNAALGRASAFEGHIDAWARGAVVPPTLAAPAPTVAGTPLAVAVIDDPVDPAVGDVGPQTRWLNGPPPAPVTGSHGTEVASAAAAAADGQGVVGLFPGLPILSYGLPPEINCADTADGILAAAAAEARVINLSLGGATDCFSLYVAVERAYAGGSLVVASGGNDFLAGNPVVYPAAYPHVLSVAAVDEHLRWAEFSSANVAIDLAAPGVFVPVSLPPEGDTTDGTQDGITLANGTSFAAPIVAGAAAWLAAARPKLSSGQIADLLRHTARDLEQPGYDPLTGYGLVDLAAALVAPTPRTDPLEPNDGITFVDGSAFGRPDPQVWRGTGRHTIDASVDAVEDPVDVYRIRVPGHARFSISVKPSTGDPDLVVYASSAKSINDDSRVLVRSRHKGRKTEVVRLVNGSGSTRAAYIAVAVSADTSEFASTYALRFSRLTRQSTGR